MKRTFDNYVESVKFHLRTMYRVEYVPELNHFVEKCYNKKIAPRSAVISIMSFAYKFTFLNQRKEFLPEINDE